MIQWSALLAFTPPLPPESSLDLTWPDPFTLRAVFRSLGKERVLPTGACSPAGPFGILGSQVCRFMCPGAALHSPFVCGKGNASLPLCPVQVGSLVVSILPSGNLRSANNLSAPANTTAMVTLGSWGDGVSSDLVTKSTSSLRVTLRQPPSILGRYAVTAFLVQVRAHGVWVGDSRALTHAPTDRHMLRHRAFSMRL